MKGKIFKIWIKNIYKSFIWLMLPLFIFGNVQSCNSFRNAGTHLTPYSVSVRGYTRSDGTSVRSHSRRPPGSVTHDAPYERKRFYMGILFLFCLVGSGTTIFIYSKMSLTEIEEFREKLRKEEIRKREEEKQKLANEIINLIDIDCTKLKNKPSLLLSGKRPLCKFCKKRIEKEDFYISFKAISNIHYVCMNCILIKNSFGRYQPRSSYIAEIHYIYDYIKLFSKFKAEFTDKNYSNEFDFYEYELKRIFATEIKKLN